MCKSLYRLHLEEEGFASTRAWSLDDAISELHCSVCQIDSSEKQKPALDSLLNKTVRELLTEYGIIEELRHDF